MQYSQSAQQFKNPFRPFQGSSSRHIETTMVPQNILQERFETILGEENLSIASPETEDPGEGPARFYNSSSSASGARSPKNDSESKGKD